MTSSIEEIILVLNEHEMSVEKNDIDFIDLFNAVKKHKAWLQLYAIYPYCVKDRIHDEVLSEYIFSLTPHLHDQRFFNTDLTDIVEVVPLQEVGLFSDNPFAIELAIKRFLLRLNMSPYVVNIAAGNSILESRKRQFFNSNSGNLLEQPPVEMFKIRIVDQVLNGIIDSTETVNIHNIDENINVILHRPDGLFEKYQCSKLNEHNYNSVLERRELDMQILNEDIVSSISVSDPRYNIWHHHCNKWDLTLSHFLTSRKVVFKYIERYEFDVLMTENLLKFRDLSEDVYKQQFHGTDIFNMGVYKECSDNQEAAMILVMMDNAHYLQWKLNNIVDVADGVDVKIKLENMDFIQDHLRHTVKLLNGI